MMKRYLSFLLMLAFTLNLLAQVPGTPDESFGENGGILIDLDIFDECLSVHNSSTGVNFALGNTGAFDDGGFNMDAFILKLNDDGTPNESFQSSGSNRFDFAGFTQSYLRDSHISDEDILYSLGIGYNDEAPEIQPFCLGAFDHFGNPISSFGEEGFVSFNFLGFTDDAYAITTDDDDKIIVVGTSFDTLAAHQELPAIARINPDGSLDTSFGGSGKLVLNFATGLIDPDSLIGMPSERHTDGGYFTDVIVLDDNRILAVGAYYNTLNYQCMMAMFLPSGILDTSFHENGILLFDLDPGYNNFINSFHVNGSQEIIMGIRIDDPTLSQDMFLASLRMDGNWIEPLIDIDDDGMNNYISDIIMEGNEKILITGHSTYPENESSAYMGNFFTTSRIIDFHGHTDEDFAENGVLSFSFGDGITCASKTIATQQDGRILVGGIAGGIGENLSDLALLRLNGDPDISSSIDQHSNGTNKLSAIVYPNPASDQLHIEFDPTEVIERIYCVSLDGRTTVLHYEYFSSGFLKVDITSLKNGMFVLIIETKSSSYSSSFVKF